MEEPIIAYRYHRMCDEVASSRVTLRPALAEHDDAWTWKSCQRCPGTMASNSEKVISTVRVLEILTIYISSHFKLYIHYIG